jgi:hypothetical protein
MTSATGWSPVMKPPRGLADGLGASGYGNRRDLVPLRDSGGAIEDIELVGTLTVERLEKVAVRPRCDLDARRAQHLLNLLRVPLGLDGERHRSVSEIVGTKSSGQSRARRRPRVFGRGGRIRTAGLLLPNQKRRGSSTSGKTRSRWSAPTSEVTWVRSESVAFRWFCYLGATSGDVTSASVSRK